MFKVLEGKRTAMPRSRFRVFGEFSELVKMPNYSTFSKSSRGASKSVIN